MNISKNLIFKHAHNRTGNHRPHQKNRFRQGIYNNPLAGCNIDINPFNIIK